MWGFRRPAISDRECRDLTFVLTSSTGSFRFLHTKHSESKLASSEQRFVMSISPGSAATSGSSRSGAVGTS
jgi:hypothetical protein